MSTAPPCKLRPLDVQHRFLKCLKSDRRHSDLAKYLHGKRTSRQLEFLTAYINHLIENPGFGEWRIGQENQMQERRDKLHAAVMVIEEIFEGASRMWLDERWRHFADVALPRTDTKHAVIAGLKVMDEILRKWGGPQTLPARSAWTRPYHAMAMFLCGAAQTFLFHLDCEKRLARQMKEMAPLERKRDELRRSQPGSEELRRIEQRIDAVLSVSGTPSVIPPTDIVGEAPRQPFDTVTYRFVREMLVYVLPDEKIPTPESLQRTLTGSPRSSSAR